MAHRNHRDAASRPSIYQTVTARFIASLKAGVIPWEKPWKAPRYTGGPFPRNFYTGKPYRGINVILLWSSEFSSPFWLTFKQAQALKGTITSPTEYRAYYRPSTDSVHMPARSRFVDAPRYYSTLFHELVHSTGDKSRLHRTFGDRFGDELYSEDELVAELGAVFLCAIAGIANDRTDRNTTAYIQNWIAKLEEDNRLIVHAAAHAQRAVDLILGSTFEAEKETTENAGDAAVSGIPAAVANIAPAIYGHTHL